MAPSRSAVPPFAGLCRRPLASLVGALSLALSLPLAACASFDDESEPSPAQGGGASGKGQSGGAAGRTDGKAGQAGGFPGGGAGGSGGQGGSAQAGQGGSVTAGSGGSPQAGSGGGAQAGSGGSSQAGSGGQAQGGGAGKGGSPAGGQGGSSAGSAGSTAGQGGAGQGGSSTAGGGGGTAACPCLLDGPSNFCQYARFVDVQKDTAYAGCAMWKPGQYCNPDGDFDEATNKEQIDWGKGWADFQAQCKPTCGDGHCSEECESCPQDCSSCPAKCGDGTCDSGETFASCPKDCPNPCGNGTCDNGETFATCSKDCPPPGPECGDKVCNGAENPVSCKPDCPPPPVDAPDRLMGIHFWLPDVPSKLGTAPYYDVEVYPSSVDPNQAAGWLKEREATGARILVRIDYDWGHAVPVNAQEQALYNERVSTFVETVAAAGLKTHHYIVGNETNLPIEGAASPEQAGAAYVSVRNAVLSQGKWSIKPVFLPSAPSTAAEFGGADGSYFRKQLQAIKNAGVTPEGLAIHAYENSNGGGSANLFIDTVRMHAQVINEVGFAGIPTWITEFNVNLTESGDAVGATFIQNAAKRLNDFNNGGEGNPNPGKLAIVSACHFVWNDPIWPQYSIASRPATLAAFVQAWNQHPSGKIK